MSSGHFNPGARANSHRRHYKRSPARLSARDAVDDDDNDVFGKKQNAHQDDGGLLESLTTVVESLILPGTTILNTQVLPFGDLPTAGLSAPSAPASQPTDQSSSSSSSSSASSSSSSSSSVSSTSSSSITSTSASSSSVVAPPTAASPSSVPPAKPTAPPHTNAPSPSASSLGAGAATNPTHKGLSGGAVGGIVAVVLIAIIAISIFVVRKTLLRRRKNKRTTWSAGVFPKAEQEQDVFEKSPTFTLAAPPPVPEKSPYLNVVPMPPPMSYNNPISSSPTTLQPALGGPAVSLTPASFNANVAIVRCTFIPSLPDELSISTGEIVRVLNEYDDGWSLCCNEQGEQGVVPLECLDRASSSKKGPGSYLGQGTGDWRMSKRASSLIGPGDAAATRY